MSLRELLETFEAGSGTATAGTGADAGSALSAADLASARSEGYEAGYKSGWDDAQKSDDAAHQRVAAEFERNIETLAFTFHEAVDLVRGELRSLVSAMLDTFLPAVIPDLTREHVRNALLDIAEKQLSATVEIVVSPDCQAMIEELLTDDFALDLGLVSDPDLAPSQVFLRLAERQTVVDLLPLVDELRNQLAATRIAETEEIETHA